MDVEVGRPDHERQGEAPPRFGADPVREGRPAGAVEQAPRPARIGAGTGDELRTPAQQLRRPEQLRRLRSAAPRGLDEARPVEGIDDGPPDRGARLGHVQGFIAADRRDRKSTRLNSSHLVISYAVFCLKKKKKKKTRYR